MIPRNYANSISLEDLKCYFSSDTFEPVAVSTAPEPHNERRVTVD